MVGPWKVVFTTDPVTTHCTVSKPTDARRAPVALSEPVKIAAREALELEVG